MTQRNSRSNEDEVVANLSGRAALAILQARLTDNLESYFPAPLAKRARVVRGSPLGGRFAKTFRFDVSVNDGMRTVYMKICPLYERLDPAKQEYETLKLLYHLMPSIDGRCRVSRPLGHFPDMNAYAMESVGGHDLRSFLFKNNRTFSSTDSVRAVEAALKGSARWLRTFHELTKSKNAVKFRSSPFLESIKDEFDYRRLREFGFGAATLESIEQIVGRITELDNVFELPCAKWHWDFTPGHVFLDDGKFSVIDILGLDDIPIFEDIGRFLAAMTSMNSPSQLLLFDRGRASGELCDIFSSAYNAEEKYESAFFNLFSNIFRLKHTIIFFGGHNTKVANVFNNGVAKLYCNTIGVRIFEYPIARTIREINRNITYLTR